MKIIEIVYSSDTGTILPELQWHEEIRITAATVIFSRNGKTQDSQVNKGSWRIPADAAEIQRLLTDLQTVDCSKIKRVELPEAPDGAGTRSYTLNYDSGKTCLLYFDGGNTYEQAEKIVAPLDEFIGNLNFPDEAKRRY